MACKASAVAVSRRASGEGVGPGGVAGLQGEQLGDGVIPALRPDASVGGSAVADDAVLFGVAGAVEGLALGIAERLAAAGVLWHACSPLRNA